MLCISFLRSSGALAELSKHLLVSTLEFKYAHFVAFLELEIFNEMILFLIYNSAIYSESGDSILQRGHP